MNASLSLNFADGLATGRPGWSKERQVQRVISDMVREVRDAPAPGERLLERIAAPYRGSSS